MREVQTKSALKLPCLRRRPFLTDPQGGIPPARVARVRRQQAVVRRRTIRRQILERQIGIVAEERRARIEEILAAVEREGSADLQLVRAVLREPRELVDQFTVGRILVVVARSAAE